jgi:hypothetical protein
MRMRRACGVIICLATLLSGCIGEDEDLTLRSDLTASAGAYRIGAGAVFRSEASKSIKVVGCLGSLRGLRQSDVNGHSLLVVACGSDAKMLVSFVVDDVFVETVDYCELFTPLPASAQVWWRDYSVVFASGDSGYCR